MKNRMMRGIFFLNKR